MRRIEGNADWEAARALVPLADGGLAVLSLEAVENGGHLGLVEDEGAALPGALDGTELDLRVSPDVASPLRGNVGEELHGTLVVDEPELHLDGLACAAAAGAEMEDVGPGEVSLLTPLSSSPR